MTEFVFDWQKESENFVKWMLVNLLSKGMNYCDTGQKWLDDMTKITNDFTDVRMQVLINGVEVDTKEFVEALERSLDLTAKDEASRMVSELTPLATLRDFTDKLNESLEGYDTAIRRHVQKLVKDQGIEIYDWEQ